MIKRFSVLIIALLLVVTFSAYSAQAQSVAIAEFELDRQYREFQDDLDNKLLDYVLEYFDKDVFQVKERLREIDILRERSLSSSDRRRLRENLKADFLVLPRLSNIKIEEKQFFSISFSSEDSDSNIDFGVKKAIVEIEVSARVVDLRTGNIETGFVVEKEDTFSVGSVKINKRNVFEEKGSEIIKDVLDPATEELALIVVAEIEDLFSEYGEENAKIVEVSPHGIDEYIIAEVQHDSSRFRTGRDITIYKPGSVGGRVPVGTGTIIDRDGDYVTIELIEQPKVDLEIGDSLQTSF